jgi:thioredoxin reductase (NADPH)
MNNKIYDVIIIGAGPAGLTSAIYTTRKRMKTLVISKNIGGQTSITFSIENYPGFNNIDGYELMKNFEEQAKKFGAEIVFGDVYEINRENNTFVIRSNSHIYKSRTLILAFGKTPRDMKVPGEEDFKGKGVSYCATCDAPLFNNKVVAVVGGGNSALESSLLFAKMAKKVYLIHRRDEFRGDAILVERVMKEKKIEIILNSVPVEVGGTKFVNSFIIKNVKTEKTRELKLDGIFVEIGYEVKTDTVKDLVKLNKNNEIIVNVFCETSHPGIFAAGDVTDVPYKQIVIAAGEGAKAGMSAYNYLQKMNGKDVIIGDWKH